MRKRIVLVLLGYIALVGNGSVFAEVNPAPDARRDASQRAGGVGEQQSSRTAEQQIRRPDNLVTDRVLGRYKVRSVVFVGNRKYKSETLRKRLGFEIAGYIDPALAEARRRTLHRFYREKGFAFVEVTLDSEQLRKGNVIYTVDEGPRVKIRKVSFSGNNRISTKTLKKVTKTNKKKWFIWPRYYNEAEMTEDVTRLQIIYYERGFLDSNIVAQQPQFSEDGRKVDITFAIEEGPRYIIEKIDFIGNKRLDEERLRAELKLEQGQIYSERRALSDAERLLKLYREYGFIDAEVKRLMPRFVQDVNAVDVEFKITEGEQFRIGRLDITGNEQTQDKVIRQVLDEYDFQPGKWYNADIAPVEGGGELERGIQRRVLAEAVSIRPWGKSYAYDRHKEVRVTDAEVNIKEGLTGLWRVAGGASLEAGVFGLLEFRQANFDISDWPESFDELISVFWPGEPPKAFTGAGQKFSIMLQPGIQQSRHSVSFSEPYLNGKPVSLDVLGTSYEIVGKHYDEICYDEGRTKGYVGFEKRYENGWRRSMSFRLENIKLDNLEPNSPIEIQSVKGTNALMGVKFGIRRDLTDNRFNPSTGYSFSADYEQVAGDYSFGILGGTYRRYKTLYKDSAERKTVLATKLHAATVIGDAPPFEKFYAGGRRTLRGFEYRGATTRGRNPLTGELNYPIGSDWIFLVSAEVAVPLVSEELAALFFVDSGAVDSGGYRASVGTGVKAQLGPVPIELYVAVPFMKDDADNTVVWGFFIGWPF